MKRSPLRERIRSERGQVILLVALLMVPILGMVGIAMDSGYLFYTRRAMQTAADTAAIAGSLDQVSSTSTLTSVTVAAKADAKTNGFEDGVDDVTVTVHSPPTSGNFQNGDYVEVIIARTKPTIFMNLLSLVGAGSVASPTVRARAVAGRASILACFVALNTTAASAFFIGGNATINTPACGIFVNSTSTTALSSGSNGQCVTNLSTDVVGGESLACGFSPAPVPGAGASNDPLAGLPVPTRPSGACSATPAPVSGTITLNPNTPYCTITITGGGTTTLALTPGATSRVIYIDGVGGTGFSLSGGPGTSVTSTNIMFYVASGSVNVSTQVAMNFSAPTTAQSTTYGGILFFMGRSNNSATTFTGAGTTNCKALNGIFYAVQSDIDFGGAGGSTGSCTTNVIFIADTIQVAGNFSIGSPLVVPRVHGKSHLVE